MSQSEASSDDVSSSKSRWASLNQSDPVVKRIDMWLGTCMCENKESPYCTYCEILWDARERIELLESIHCAKAFDEGMV